MLLIVAGGPFPLLLVCSEAGLGFSFPRLVWFGFVRWLGVLLGAFGFLFFTALGCNLALAPL